MGDRAGGVAQAQIDPRRCLHRFGAAVGAEVGRIVIETRSPDAAHAKRCTADPGSLQTRHSEILSLLRSRVCSASLRATVP